MVCMKSSIAQLILSKLAELGYITADVLFPKKYPWAAISRPLFGLDDYPRVSRKTLSSIVSRMKRQGLIERKGKGLFKDIVLTKRGRERIERKPLKEKKDLPAADRIIRLVIFDIPEKQRRKRDALRQELFACGYEPLQKSVWLGMRPLTREFVDMVDELEIKDYIHIFSVKQEGTLEDMSTAGRTNAATIRMKTKDTNKKGK